jgi:hypothetical protein
MRHAPVGAVYGTPMRLAGGPSRPLERQGLDRALGCACAVQTWDFRRNVHHLTRSCGIYILWAKHVHNSAADHHEQAYRPP